MSTMNGGSPTNSKSVPEIIGVKLAGDEMNEDDFHVWIEKLVNKEIADAQVGAWLAAVYLKGLSNNEISYLTRCMAESGARLIWPEDWDLNLVVDKHSTGGVGDKVSLPLAPALAACGLKVPMISGRGLGITGGTLDKLESIPNFNVELSMGDMKEALEEVGCFIAGQTKDICPADKILYSIRDITGTVGERGLVTSSIVSKKVAEGLSSLVLDVKWGLGCYQDNFEQGEELALSLRRTAASLGVNTTAVISHMNAPLGNAVGNSLEVLESIECLQGGGPADLRELVCVQGGLLLLSSGLAKTKEEGNSKMAEVLDNGSALNKFKQMLINQGVERELAERLVAPNNENVLKPAKFKTKLVSERAGYITTLHARNIARIACDLGAGRKAPGDLLDHTVGVQLSKSLGDYIEAGEAYGEIHHNQSPLPSQILQLAGECLEVDENPGKPPKRINKIIE